MSDPIKRVNYLDRMFVRQRDMDDEQNYHIRLRRQRNEALYSPGVAKGLLVSGDLGSDTVTVDIGAAIDAQGRDIVLVEPQSLTMPTGEQSVDIFISYQEVPSDPSTDPGITGFTRINEIPKIDVVAATQTPPADAIRLALVPLNSANGQVNGTIDNSVRTGTGTNIGDGSITALKLADDAVTAAKLRDAAEAEDDQRAVTSDHIRNLSVTTAKLADNAVSAAKLQADAASDANRAVGTDHIQDNAVTAAKLQSDTANDANRAVTTDHVKDNAITQAKVASGAISINNLKSQLAAQGSENYGGPQPTLIPPGSALPAGFYITNFSITGGSVTIQDEITSTGRKWRVTSSGPFPTGGTIHFTIYRIEET